MQIKRLIISTILMVAYTMGMAHELIPHCHHDEGMAMTEGVDSAHEHLHQHHVHQEDESHDHDHISHDDHLDEGVVDFLICVLSSADHPDPFDSSCHYLPSQPSYSSVKLLSHPQLATLVMALMNVDLDVDRLTHEGDETPTFFHSPPITGISYRGPPLVSC